MKLTNPDKILYAEDDISKIEIAEYYMQVADWILPYITNRPLTLLRCPESYKKCFYQKHIAESMPDGIHSIEIKEKAGRDDYIYIKNKTGLLSLVQMGVLEIHPWGSTIKHLEKPDIIVFDLDPSPEVSWKELVAAAFDVKHHLAKIKLESFVRTTGGKGLHVVLPVKPKHDWDEVKEFTKSFVDFLVKESPDEYIGHASKHARKHKIFLDYLRNGRGATAITSYSTRAREHAPIATPLTWKELETAKKPINFTIKTIMKRLNALKKDPWQEFFEVKQSF